MTSSATTGTFLDRRADDWPDRLTVTALLNCLVRELITPRGDLDLVGEHALIRLSGTGRLLRLALSRPLVGEPQLTGSVEDYVGGQWSRLTREDVVDAVHAELSRLNDTADVGLHLRHEIATSHALIAAAHRSERERELAFARPRDSPAESAEARYLASEQSLIAGHRFHPAPKARSAELEHTLRYSPETVSSFRLRYLAVPDELIWEREAAVGDAAVFDTVFGERPRGEGPAGLPRNHRLLPIHPWQYQILNRGSAFATALRSGAIRDLGELGPPVQPTSSVRTVTAPGSGFLKLSLSVQITNCFRVNPRHEVEAATTLSRLLKPLRTELKQRFPGTVLLSEPAGRAPRLGSDLTDQLGVISREGWQDKLPPGVVPVLAAALTEPVPTPYVARILAEASTGRDRILRWWNGYLNCVVPPVLYAFFNHGIVFEAHLQNILLGIDRNGNPQAVVLRDLEGVKLVDSQPDRAVELAAMPTKVREHVATTTARGWNRVAYCLLVNNVAGVLSALADRDPDAEPALWSQVRATLQFFRRRHGDFPLLRAVLEGHPVPAKMNLMTRWRASADRDSNYVPVNLPLGLK